ncbi:RluA family pseudouridine synthase [Pandoraea nosoerga]|uniref:Pseudouridine synthase n=1 Tax=Pandoraea nosoerga TaxID=2508296 RepID=A0A5E4SA22_9BURK|nr:RluA family pseudouridine synthase [Pandoraea nosoerga]MBN4665826.1 RluA family pseudouridine synthase [Pandoraea nosoerga]VVD72001.1 RluA family pseudouridine synthase [Pandoraea nosoerga]
MTRSILPDYSVTASLATENADDSSDDDFDSLAEAFPGAAHGIATSTDASTAAPAPGGPAPSSDQSGQSIANVPLSATLPDAVAGERLDKALALCFPEYSRSRLQAWVEDGRVALDGVTAKVRQKVAGGESVLIMPAALPEQLAFAPEPVPLDAVYEDAALVVFNKPPGLVVHPAAGNWSGTLLNGLLHRYGHAAADLPRAGIVHRLDKETSGLMVVARTLIAQTDLVRQLQARTVKRHYAALVWGRPPLRTIVDAPIGRDPRERTRMAVVQGQGGKPARTRVATVASGEWEGSPVSLVLCSLDTGRTHQIRVHLSHLGHSLLGDPLYKPRHKRPALPGDFARQALHAWRLGLLHPDDGRAMHWQAALPGDMQDLMAAIGLEFDFSTLPDSLDDFFPA